jgi:hypothetical protein
MPVLIQVPALANRSRRSCRYDRGSVMHRDSPPRRRRLRNEVRLVASVMLLGLPASWVLGSIGGIRSDRLGGASPVRTEARSLSRPLPAPADPPLVSIWLEQDVSTESMKADVPVVRPAGYILPEDGLEEVVHAGS